MSDLKRSQELNRATTALNEVMHASGVFAYDDRDMALAFAEHLKIEPPKYSFKTQADVMKWSNWWHPKFDIICS